MVVCKHQMIPHSAVKKLGTNWAKGPDGRWSASVYFWAATRADGTHEQYATHVTRFTKYWCRFHRWATDFVCCPRIGRHA